ncbi:tyrosine--tRNA ligase [Paenibacillus sp. CGMCC 1.16610]|uniref:Tyrosine--tRNA ligase n=1 Tax=Paenibacillus anseongense TaxID=2682845 RepID=A0ABW9UCB1_9BACL|nr:MULTISPECIES: tyrosine--tRNA ligase [Paenibacillus]MBA2937963.1 tyrosine--tRNA ligase [Paenibacillus sp. CGMCC 1.16610]MVQ37021.1 tyrosine--tRNA ligase [Paenibacillus anseongense]
MSILKDLEFRGLLHQITDREGLDKKLSEERVVLYCGFDPTADSLHIGSLLPILTLRRFQLAGHIPLALVGGGTGLIGDPSGKANERTLNGPETVEAWSQSIKGQLSRFLDFSSDIENSAELVNNYDWLGSLNVIEFLRDVGKNFTVNYMLAKDSVDSRITKGISFTEFSYMILQSYDFLKLNETKNCSLQIGGSDQWGNITAGLELIGKTTESRAYGVTLPLVTKSDGQKFGKTEGGAIWLDASKTSPYQFYQFWLGTADNDVIRFLKYFTFISHEEIEQLEVEVQTQPEKREAQKLLAREVTKLVHGGDALESALNITAALFSGNIQDLSRTEIEEAFKDVPSSTLEQEDMPLVDLLIAVGAAPSKRQARQDIESGAVTVNGVKITELDAVAKDLGRLGESYIVIRRGKKNYYLAQFK